MYLRLMGYTVVKDLGYYKRILFGVKRLLWQAAVFGQDWMRDSQFVLFYSCMNIFKYRD